MVIVVRPAGQIMLAANYSGRAINITATTAAHAMSYKITSMYNLPHGHAVAVCLPEIWDFMVKHRDKVTDERGQMHVYKIFKLIAETMGVKEIREAIAQFRLMMSDMNLSNPTSINDHEKEIEILSSSVNPVRLRNNPVQFLHEEIVSIYSKVIR